MLKRMLVLLGETPSSQAARRYAFRLAQETGAALTGLAGIDLTAIEAPMLGALGASAFKVKMEEKLKEQASDIRTRLHRTFEQECATHGVGFDWLSFEGDPLGALQLAAETRDLVLTGHDTSFEGNVRNHLSEAIANLLATTPRPVVVCGDQADPHGPFLVAYDGSVAAMRAIQMFALLGLGAGKRVYVASIDADQELATRRVAGACTYLRAHGYEVEGVPVASEATPAEVIGIEVADRAVGTVVMGAYGARGWREALFGSTTAELVEHPPCALLLYH